MVRRRGSSLLFTLIALGMAIGSRPAHGQTISFLRPLNGVDPKASTPGGGTVAADASGVYVGLDGGVLAKFDSHGNVLWTRTTGANNLFGPASGGAGVYVSGRIYNQPNPIVYFLRRYDAGGNELWNLQTDVWFNLVADASGVYVAGTMAGQTTTTLYVRKYDSSGAEQWTRTFLTLKSGVVSSGISVAVGASGLYVAGGDESSTTLGKYDLASGNELWNRQLPRFVGPPMTVDNTGVYFVNNGPNPFLRKYDPSGNELWTRPVGAIPRALAADATGIYVAGLTGSGFLPGQCRSGLGGDAFVRKYDHDGTVLWTRESFSASYSSSSQATSVAIDDTGVYVDGSGGFDAPNTGEAFLARLEKTAMATDSRPRISPGCPVNGASYVGGGVVPGEIVTIFGAAMGPPGTVPLSLTVGGRLDTTLAGARILFNGVPAPLLYVSDKQSSAIVPYAVAGRTSVDVQVEYQGVQSDVVTAPVLASRPGIFSLDGSGQGPLAILNENGSVNSPSNPADRGSIITIYATGGGERDPAVADGQILSDVLTKPSLPISVWFDNGPESDFNADGEVLYAGGSPGSVAGLLQINVRVPTSAVAGKTVAFGLAIGSERNPGSLTIALR